MSNIIDIFVTLGERLRGFGYDEKSRTLIGSAIEQNAWFTEQDIHNAVEAIRTQMLVRTKIEEWLHRYPTATTPQRVVIIMAGNIPLVGFFDLMCVLFSGQDRKSVV